MCHKTNQTVVDENEVKYHKNVSLETALDLTGFGKYNFLLLLLSCMAMLGVALDLSGMSFVIPASACDLNLTIEEKGFLTAIPLLGLVIMCYPWGYLADTKGRRTVLLFSMTFGFVMSIGTSFSPNMPTIAVLKFLSVASSSAANSVTYTLLGECVPRKQRDRMITYSTSAMLFSGGVLAAVAIPILGIIQFRYPIEFLGIDFSPWRLYMIILAIPLAIAAVLLLFASETPKFLMAQGKHDDALMVLKRMYRINTGRSEDTYPVLSLQVEEFAPKSTESKLKSLWTQFSPLFKKPLLKYSIILYYCQFWVYFVANMLFLWVPFISEIVFNEADHPSNSSGNICAVLSNSLKRQSNLLEEFSDDCTATVKIETSVALIISSTVIVLLNIILAFIVNFTGKKTLVIGVLLLTGISGVIMNLSLNLWVGFVMFYLFMYISLTVGLISSYLVDLYPTYIRGMSICIGIMIGRLGGMIGTNIFGYLVEDYCSQLMYCAATASFSCIITVIFLPAEKRKEITEGTKDIEK